MRIDSYTFGSMTVDGKMHTSDLIVFPDRVSSSWWRVEGHSLCMEDLTEVTGYAPDVLIVGLGASGCMNIPSATREKLENAGIEVIDRNTGEAWQIFNEKIKEGKKVVGAFHLTC
ncbi:MAG: MTH938/NDUFAF3 family protein [Candidatus Omnitrophota bacterium]|nr:MTH938/NDUFAF3 family protein [Candidatus Omnitrophota bacterium]